MGFEVCYSERAIEIMEIALCTWKDMVELLEFPQCWEISLPLYVEHIM